MTIHEFGDRKNPVIMLFPRTICYGKGNFRNIIKNFQEVHIWRFAY